MIVTPVMDGCRFTARGHLLDPDGERMTAWAEKYVKRDQDIAWVLGNFVEASNANGNGHIFPLKDLEETAVHTVANKPLNMLHHENYIVGAFAGAEMVYPEGGGTSPTPAKEHADDQNGHPYMEALAAMWRHIYPDEYIMLQKAQAEGNLYFSMEATAESLTFVDYNVTVPYMGRQHDSYPTKDVEAKRILNKPHFGGGAIIIPPAKPGWSRADIKSLDSFLEEQPSVAEAMFKDVKSELSHLSPESWDSMMLQLVNIASQD